MIPGQLHAAHRRAADRQRNQHRHQRGQDRPDIRQQNAAAGQQSENRKVWNAEKKETGRVDRRIDHHQSQITAHPDPELVDDFPDDALRFGDRLRTRPRSQLPLNTVRTRYSLCRFRLGSSPGPQNSASFIRNSRKKKIASSRSARITPIVPITPAVKEKRPPGPLQQIAGQLALRRFVVQNPG